jgi:MoaA/NifB/PqqE/SkfB family radical SAM enzyme
METAQNTSDFWIFTSGYNFSRANALRLKAAGLTGVNISLDHHLAEKHNRFRRNPKAFQWVLEAAKNAREAKLVITMCVCATREYCKEEHLLAYLHLAKTLGASFVQILEPRAVGNYAGQDVELNAEHFAVLDKFFLEVNDQEKYKAMPIVLFPSFHQRQTGCPGAGSKYLYVDTDGYMNSCPFCRNKKTHILNDDHEEVIKELKMEGCGKFEFLN